MKAVYKKTETVVNVEPFYLYGRIVAYVGKLYESMPYNGIVECIGTQKKYAYLPDELDFEAPEGMYKTI